MGRRMSRRKVTLALVEFAGVRRATSAHRVVSVLTVSVHTMVRAYGRSLRSGTRPGHHLPVEDLSVQVLSVQVLSVQA